MPNCRLRFLGALNALIVAIEYLCDATHSAALLTGDMLPLTLQALSSVISDEVFPCQQCSDMSCKNMYSHRMYPFDKWLRNAPRRWGA